MGQLEGSLTSRRRPDAAYQPGTFRTFSHLRGWLVSSPSRIGRPAPEEVHRARPGGRVGPRRVRRARLSGAHGDGATGRARRLRYARRPRRGWLPGRIASGGRRPGHHTDRQLSPIAVGCRHRVSRQGSYRGSARAL